MDKELKEVLKGIRGFRDFYPEDFAEIRRILSIMREVSGQFGYEEYEGPSVEYAKLIEYKSGQSLASETFHLYDREERKLALRPEQTPTLARMVTNQQQRYAKPMRWFSIPRVFRDETPQRGRVKEHFQFNADLIGFDHVGADAEIIALTTTIIKKAGLNDEDFVCTINSRELVQSFIEYLGISNYLDIIKVIDSREKYIQDFIQEDLEEKGVPKDQAAELSLLVRTAWMQDSKLEDLGKKLLENKYLKDYMKNLDEIAESVIKNAFKDHGLTAEKADKLYRFASIKAQPKLFVERMRNEADIGDKANEALKKMENLIDYLEMYGVLVNCIYDASIARGLDYYTGIVYEFYDRTGSVVRSIAGGGRYDQLVESFGGGLIPATGIGMGETVLLSVLKQLGRIPKYIHPAKVYVAPISKDVVKEAAKIANELRNHFETIFNPFNWKLSRQLEDANNRGTPFMIIVGERDLKQNKVTIRELDTGDQDLIDVSSVTDEIKKRIT
ncbi:MAG: histidine--tRNA ligase [Candidatus Thorarchaeota archaeon]